MPRFLAGELHPVLVLALLRPQSVALERSSAASQNPPHSFSKTPLPYRNPVAKIVSCRKGATRSRRILNQARRPCLSVAARAFLRSIRREKCPSQCQAGPSWIPHFEPVFRRGKAHA